MLEELGLLFHVVAFPQGKPVKLRDSHPKDVKKRLRCKGAQKLKKKGEKKKEGRVGGERG